MSLCIIVLTIIIAICACRGDDNVISILSGRSLTLTCNVPLHDAVWYHQLDYNALKTRVNDTRSNLFRLDNESHVFTLLYVSDRDSGTYECEAYTNYRRSTYRVRVYNLTTDSLFVYTQYGYSVQLYCKSSFNINIKWKKLNNAIGKHVISQSFTTSTLMVYKVTDAVSEYECSIRLRDGTSMSVIVSVHARNVTDDCYDLCTLNGSHTDLTECKKHCRVEYEYIISVINESLPVGDYYYYADNRLHRCVDICLRDEWDCEHKCQEYYIDVMNNVTYTAEDGTTDNCYDVCPGSSDEDLFLCQIYCPVFYAYVSRSYIVYISPATLSASRLPYAKYVSMENTLYYNTTYNRLHACTDMCIEDPIECMHSCPMYRSKLYLSRNDTANCIDKCPPATTTDTAVLECNLHCTTYYVFLRGYFETVRSYGPLSVYDSYYFDKYNRQFKLCSELCVEDKSTCSWLCPTYYNRFNT